jgi:transcriptional regulator with XRE-family HTH domain
MPHSDNRPASMAQTRNLCGPAVARLRRQQGLTQAELRDRCRDAGWSAARSVLAKIEKQNRAVSDYELVALAGALGVGVMRLLREAPSKRRKD